ncbi:hypothetical protein BDV96DRAFT_323608 [Lophiotrema nucula]|uniref:Uncharacterized protein n=1 Tax=Lophiotrema nucula TaxID=690887 RepID=A0A6A5ZPY1_9PLEO|nr:hypothetical protein BDV96DRAFT_323608 [Lophiotrema nucula]
MPGLVSENERPLQRSLIGKVLSGTMKKSKKSNWRLGISLSIRFQPIAQRVQFVILHCQSSFACATDDFWVRSRQKENRRPSGDVLPEICIELRRCISYLCCCEYEVSFQVQRLLRRSLVPTKGDRPRDGSALDLDHWQPLLHHHLRSSRRASSLNIIGGSDSAINKVWIDDNQTRIEGFAYAAKRGHDPCTDACLASCAISSEVPPAQTSPCRHTTSVEALANDPVACRCISFGSSNQVKRDGLASRSTFVFLPPNSTLSYYASHRLGFITSVVAQSGVFLG